MKSQIIVILFVGAILYFGITKMIGLSKTTDFTCSHVSSTSFSFPLPGTWKYSREDNEKSGYCLARLTFDQKDPTGKTPNYIEIVVFKKESDPSSKITKTGASETGVKYTLYDNRELRTASDISILIRDKFVSSGGVEESIPAEANGFNYQKFWREVTKSLND